MNHRLLLFSLLLSFVLAACSRDTYEGEDITDDSVQWLSTEELEIQDTKNPNYEEGVRNAIAKAQLMSSCSWKALSDVPSTVMSSNRWDYPASGQYSIPYSSVKELDKFVGHDVSFYTFLSAPNNPRSVLYTEDVSREPYHGYNCGAYYGTVCSNSVCYALGIYAPFPSRLLCVDSDLIRKVASSSLTDLRAGDLWATQGHVIMITGISLDETTGDIHQVDFLDVCSIRHYSKEKFEQYCADRQLSWYRYYGLSRNRLDPFDRYTWPELDAITWNPDLCLSRGDRSSFREGEKVRVNLFTDQYDMLCLLKDGTLYEERTSLHPDEEFDSLPAGHYTLYLSDGNRQSEPASFEVLQAKVQISADSQCGFSFRFESQNAEPVAAVIYDEKENKMTKEFIRDLTDEERSAGVVNLKFRNLKGRFFCKIYFKGSYGIVVNEPVSFTI